MKSQIVFRRGKLPVDALSGAVMRAVSHGPLWHGLQLETGEHPGWKIVDDLMYDGHCVGMNLGPSDLRFETRFESQWVQACIPRGGFWLIPEGQPFSVRNGPRCRWAMAVVSGGFLDSLLGGHHEFDGRCGFSDALLHHLLSALVERLEEETVDRDDGLTQTLIRSFVMALGSRHGRLTPGVAAPSCLAPRQLDTVLHWVEARIAQPLTVAGMAARVDLSVAHFSRAFKRTTGQTPWAHVVKLRVERAALLLASGCTAAEVADDCGFADQAHLSRLFKRHFGVSPSAYRRGSARLPSDGRSMPHASAATIR